MTAARDPVVSRARGLVRKQSDKTGPDCIASGPGKKLASVEQTTWGVICNGCTMHYPGINKVYSAAVAGAGTSQERGARTALLAIMR
jgi:hypothetical protein